jgi:hypothetical protein|tara:strand:- start:345 stop:509 length:165 start_codon:yes stop_codon:yes gene_type:complete
MIIDLHKICRNNNVRIIDINKWCEENLSNEFSIGASSAYIKTEEDSMAFKLRWA